MRIDLAGENGSSANAVEVSDLVFGREYNEALIHQVVTAYRNAARAGTKAQKTRAEVRGGGAKPWRQKGMGRARAGSTRSPIWRTGGVTFAAKPRDYSQKINKKMYRGAMISIFSELVRAERLMVVDSFAVTAPKTKDLLLKLDKLNLSDVLIVSDFVDENLYLAARNVYKIGLCDASGIDPVSLIGYEKVLITLPALKQIEEMLG